MKGSRILAAAAVVSAVAAAGMADALAVPIPPPIGYTHPGLGAVVFGAAGSSHPWLTGLPTANGQRPAWSPNGKEIAFVCGNFALCVSSGGSVQTLAQPAWPKRWQYDGGPAWSPDGKTLAFNAGSGGSYRIYLLPATGGKPRLLLRKRLGNEEFPAWSPNGKRIAFDAVLGGGRDVIYVVDRNGGHLHALTAKGVDAHSPAWSPDGKEIAYTRITKQGSAIDVLTFATGHIRALTPGTSRDDHPAWSPDGKTVAYDGNRKGPIGIWAVPAAGGKPSRVDSGNKGPDLFPTWARSNAASFPSTKATGPSDADAMLVSTYLSWSYRIGADVFALEAGHASGVVDLVRDAAPATAAMARQHPRDAHGRRFQAAGRRAFARALVVGQDYRKVLAALKAGDRGKGSNLARTALHELGLFGTQLSRASKIAGLS